MNQNLQRPSGAFVGAAWAVLLLGVVAYLIGLWNASMQLNEKGYYFTVLMFGLFAAVALVLAAVGIYATMTYVVRQRSQEIGIRLALGARPADAIVMIVGRGLLLTGAGVAIGMTIAAIASRLMAGLLFGISTLDAVSFIGSPLTLALVSLSACLAPALRAARIDPIRTLRAD